MMDARQGRSVGAVRAVALLVATLTLLLVAALAVAPKADAHQTAGRVLLLSRGRYAPEHVKGASFRFPQCRGNETPGTRPAQLR